MKEPFIKACLARIIGQDQSTDDYRIACFALHHALTHGHREGLGQLVTQGPVHDGDVVSKSVRDDLIEWGLAHRVYCEGKEGYTAASYRGGDVLHAANHAQM